MSSRKGSMYATRFPSVARRDRPLGGACLPGTVVGRVIECDAEFGSRSHSLERTSRRRSVIGAGWIDAFSRSQLCPPQPSDPRRLRPRPLSCGSRASKPRPRSAAGKPAPAMSSSSSTRPGRTSSRSRPSTRRRRATSVGGLGGFGMSSKRSAPPAPGDVTMEATQYVVPMLKKQIWLLTDDRFADTVDIEAQTATPDHLPHRGFRDREVRGDAARQDRVRGASRPHYRAFQFYDNTYGHALVPLGGSKPSARRPPWAGSAERAPAARRDGGRLRSSRSRGTGGPALLHRRVAWGQPIAHGHRRRALRADSVPADRSGLRVAAGARRHGARAPVRRHRIVSSDQSQRRAGDVSGSGRHEERRVLVAPSHWQRHRAADRPRLSRRRGRRRCSTIQDGSTLRVLVLPTPARPALLPAPAAGREQVLLDFVVENLKPAQGIEFQSTQQLRLVDLAGGFIQPSPLSNQIACKLGDCRSDPRRPRATIRPRLRRARRQATQAAVPRIREGRDGCGDQEVTRLASETLKALLAAAGLAAVVATVVVTAQAPTPSVDLVSAELGGRVELTTSVNTATDVDRAEPDRQHALWRLEGRQSEPAAGNRVLLLQPAVGARRECRDQPEGKGHARALQGCRGLDVDPESDGWLHARRRDDAQ